MIDPIIGPKTSTSASTCLELTWRREAIGATTIAITDFTQRRRRIAARFIEPLIDWLYDGPMETIDRVPRTEHDL